MLRAYLGLGELRRPSSFGAWVCGIALNLGRMRLRQLGGEPRSEAELAGGLAVPGALELGGEPTPAETVEALEALERVRAALAILPDHEREVVLMHYLEGLTAREIAVLLGEPVGTVRVRLYRARRRLRTRLSHTREELETMVEVTVEDVVVRVVGEDADAEVPRLVNERVRVVLLKEKEGARVLPIWVGPPEGDALALQLGGESMPRPMTADLMARVVEATGARIERVAVISLREKTFYATITLAVDGSTRDVDARPSDALNLAVRVGAPIFVEPEVMDESGIALADDLHRRLERLEEEWLKDEGEPGPPSAWRSLSPSLVKAFYPGPGRK
jgi:RNA polymerase sigma factor (sigma-70 family)